MDTPIDRDYSTKNDHRVDWLTCKREITEPHTHPQKLLELVALAEAQGHHFSAQRTPNYPGLQQAHPFGAASGVPEPISAPWSLAQQLLHVLLHAETGCRSSLCSKWADGLSA